MIIENVTKIGRLTIKKNGHPRKYDHAKIRSLVEKGMMNYEIADIIGCHPSLVSALKIKWGLATKRQKRRGLWKTS